ncbi:hypothetical protein AVEN_269124-1 [Araneus ventricosus]|uniref:Uncharacterized protein n=1 Tax=Araneus ventricosus TaxID=182803 RepID=A0A4Y2SYJ5_ARAVE|nr:hypothetical protein AVEN_269124-1 [Araneus ventricosus]
MPLQREGILLSVADIHATRKRGYFTLGVILTVHKFNFHGEYLEESRFEPGKLLSFSLKQFGSILPTGNMKNSYFFSACFFGFLTTIYAVGRVNPACLEKEKAIALLETAQNFLTKAEVSFPSCNKFDNEILYDMNLEN